MNDLILASMAITLTIVRHGESTDNLKAVWAGWADAPLSNHGMNQAKALGAAFADVDIHGLYSSDLLRAQWTAQQIEKQNRKSRPTLVISELLREQNFGDAERKPFGEKGGLVRLPGRNFRFPNGESLNDVRARAHKAVSTFIEPHLQSNNGMPAPRKHLIVVGHGIFNYELIGSLLSRRADAEPMNRSHRGMTNTGWTRLEISYEDEIIAESTLSAPQTTPESSKTRPIPQQADRATRALAVRILVENDTRHLDGLRRQRGGIGSQGYDEKQKDLRAFFGGAKSDA